MKNIKQPLLVANLSAIAAILLSTLALLAFDYGPGTVIFGVYTGIAFLLLMGLVVINFLFIYFHDLILPFLAKDFKSLHSNLESWIFEKNRFSPFAISYYLLLCMKLGLPWKLNEIEQRVLAKKSYLFPKVAYLFSLHYLANVSLETAQSWYSAVLKYRNLKKRNDICIAYLCRLITDNQMDDAFSMIKEIFRSKMKHIDRLMSVYFCFMLMEKNPQMIDAQASMASSLKRESQWLVKHKKTLQKKLNTSTYYEVDIHKILLADVIKDALRWLNNWQLT